MVSPFEPLENLSEALAQTAVRYFVVGSVASGMRGVFRSTNDIDLVCDLSAPNNTVALLQALSLHFDCSLMDIPAAIAHSRSFNILHKASITKIDIFSKLTPLELNEFERAEYLPIPHTDRQIAVATAEYVILAKLRWYVQGNRVSERQLTDIRNVVRVNAERLDLQRLLAWGPRLGLSEDLDFVLSTSDK